MVDDAQATVDEDGSDVEDRRGQPSVESTETDAPSDDVPEHSGAPSDDDVIEPGDSPSDDVVLDDGDGDDAPDGDVSEYHDGRGSDDPTTEETSNTVAVPEDVREYTRFSKIDGATYERANEFLRDRTYITAREWAMARLCADFRTETGVEMTKIGENLPELVPFMTDTYSPQAVNQARSSFDEKVRKAGATFLYGAMCDFYTAEELDELMYEITEVAKFLLEVEGVELTVDEELDAEERISSVMREVRESSAALRHDELCCPNCGHEMDATKDDV